MQITGKEVTDTFYYAATGLREMVYPDLSATEEGRTITRKEIPFSLELRNNGHSNCQTVWEKLTLEINAKIERLALMAQIEIKQEAIQALEESIEKDRKLGAGFSKSTRAAIERRHNHITQQTTFAIDVMEIEAQNAYRLMEIANLSYYRSFSHHVNAPQIH
ncbi:MAG: hypothetical protein KDJ50_03995 [Alphaproteobacteria bacterium]|nr:hypothetical protein [Alphaproteobacteria bacterium]